MGIAASRSAIARCNSAAQRTASTTLANSASSPSPVFHRAAMVLLDFRIDQLAQMRPEALVRAFLVRAHQPRVARHIGGKDRGETANSGH
jgi:hypothetical protein